MLQIQGLGDTQSGNCDPSTVIGKAYCLLEGQDTSGYSQCSTQADNDPSYQAVDSQLQQIASWNPTGYFNPSDIQAVIQQQQALANNALQVLQSVGAACGTAPGCQSGDLVSQMQYNLTLNPGDSTNVMTRAQNYLSAASQAQSGAAAIAGSNYVYAPGFKQWVQDSLIAIESAIHAALVIECQMPGWVSLLGGVVSGLQSFVGFVMSIAGVAANVVQTAVAAGKTIVNATEAATGIIGFLWNNPLVLAGIAVALGLGTWYVWRHQERLKYGVGKRFGRKSFTPAVAGLRDIGPADRYEVEGRLFSTAKQAKAAAALISDQYGGSVCVNVDGRCKHRYVGGRAA